MLDSSRMPPKNKKNIAPNSKLIDPNERQLVLPHDERSAQE